MSPNTKCLNTVRLVAACIIAFGWHYQHFGTSYVSFITPVLPWCFNFGFMMVDVFFALSGFGMYVGYKERIQKRQISFYEYFSKRMVKIYPLFLISLLLVTALQFLHISITGRTFVYGNFDIKHFLMNIFLCQTGYFGVEYSFNGTAWNVSINFFLYFVFFFSACISKKHNLLWIVFGVLLLFALPIWYQRLNLPYLRNQLVARGVISFALGMFVAVFYQKKKTINTTIIGYLSSLLILLYYLMYRLDRRAFDFNYMFYVLLIPAAVLLCALYIPWINALFSAKILQFPASLSFEIFLFHFPIQCILRIADLMFNLNLDYSSPLIWLLYASLVITVSTVYKKLLSERINTFATKTANRIGRIKVPKTA